MSPPLGIFLGQKLPYIEEACNWTTLCLEAIGLSIGEPTLGLIVIQNCLASAKGITVQERIRRKDVHQQQRQQQSLQWCL